MYQITIFFSQVELERSMNHSDLILLQNYNDIAAQLLTRSRISLTDKVYADVDAKYMEMHDSA